MKILTNVLQRCIIIDKFTQIDSQFSVELLEQEAETTLSDSGVEPALAELVTDERMLGSQDFQERKLYSVVSEGLSD